jgi:hypothetical protein
VNVMELETDPCGEYGQEDVSSGSIGSPMAD